MTDLRETPGDRNLDVFEDQYPPFLMRPADKRVSAEGLAEDVANGTMEVIYALKRLVYFSAEHFNKVRENHPGISPEFVGGSFSGYTLSGFNFKNANFAGAKIEGTVFDNCELEGANFEGAIGRPADFRKCSGHNPEDPHKAAGFYPDFKTTQPQE